MTYQITVIKLEGYGPWTLGLGSDREYKLQILQSQIYSELQELFSIKNGLVFFNRADELIAITNQINFEEHKEIHTKITEKFDEIKLSMTIGINDTPLGSIKVANNIKNKNEFLIYPSIYGIRKDLQNYTDNAVTRKDTIINSDVKILHIDINDSSTLTKGLSAYEITNLIIKLYSKISDVFLEEKSLAFYLGGDNFMITARKDMDMKRVKELVNYLIENTGVKLNCGIGNGITARKAAERATKSLDEIRQHRKKGTIINVYESF